MDVVLDVTMLGRGWLVRIPLLISFIVRPASVIGEEQNNDCCKIVALEAEHQSLLSPFNSTELAVMNHWTPPVLNPGRRHLFSWRVARQPRMLTRNVTQVSAVLTLSAGGRSIDCHTGIENRLLCGFASDIQNASRCKVTLTLTLSSITAAGVAAVTNCIAQGEFLFGLTQHGWGGATWIGLTDPDDKAAQFRTVINVHDAGFFRETDLTDATLFVAGLGGYRAAVNGRALDPTAMRGSVTEWGNRTFYFGDDVTADLRTAVSGDGLVAIGLEVYKYWYALQNGFYPKAYGPRSLKAVLRVSAANGTIVFLAATCAGVPGCAWTHRQGSTVHEDLHTGIVILIVFITCNNDW